MEEKGEKKLFLHLQVPENVRDFLVQMQNNHLREQNQ